MYLTLEVTPSFKKGENPFKNEKEIVLLDYDENKIKIIYEVAYWRKANHIHNWFVQNIQDGIDDLLDYASSCSWFLGVCQNQDVLKLDDY